MFNAVILPAMLQAKQEWEQLDAFDEHVEMLEHELSISPLLARLLCIRGINTPEEADYFLAKRLKALTPPERLKGMDVAAKRFAQAINNAEPILIHGDFDVDGSTSASLLKRFCKACKHDAQAWIPDRRIDGYGLGSASLEAVQRFGSKLMITVDCGIADHGWAKRIEDESNCDVVITDHHLPQGSLPECTSVVNPNQPGCEYPDKGLAGVGVAWKLCWATANILCDGQIHEQLRNFLLDSLDLVAIGTVADCAPLNNENRIIVHHGLRALARTQNLGLQALLRHTQLLGPDPIQSDAIGWKIGPLLNASGRLSSAQRNVDLLCSDDKDEVDAILKEIIEENDERRRITQILVESVLDEFEHDPKLHERHVLVAAGEGWHPGVIGIVAGRLVDKFHKPACVIALDDGSGKGSLRSIRDVHLGEALEECRDLLISGGGHAMAAGLSIESNNVDEFRERFNAFVAAQSSGTPKKAVTQYDAEVDLDLLDQDFFGDLERLAPFGIKNPKPLLRVQDVRFAKPINIFGRDGNHARGMLAHFQGECLRPFLAWNCTEQLSFFSNTRDRFSMIVRPEINYWRGRGDTRLCFVDGCSA